jgi:predicted  nucleic acid-binding Zn-ribbon protein
MSPTITRRLRPEEEELERKRAELAAVRATLAERELELADLRGQLAGFEGRYLREVGTLYGELDEWKARISELQARLHPSAEADARAREAHEQARQTYEDAHGAASEARDFNPSLELKSLYREAAKRIHPDLCKDPDDLERRTRLMAEANRAYETGDADALHRILNEYHEGVIEGEGIGAELVRLIRQISHAKERIAAIEREVETLLESEIAQLKRDAEEAQQKGRNLLAELAASIQGRVNVAKEEYRILLREFESR